MTITGYLPGTNGFVFAPQGGLRTSAGDLAKFLLMHLQDGAYNLAIILAPGTAGLMRTSQWQYNGLNGNDYYGLIQSSGRSQRWYGHRVKLLCRENFRRLDLWVG